MTDSPQPVRYKGTIRLPHYRYDEPGAYFLTVVAAGRRNLFGCIVGGEMIPNEPGNIVTEEWKKSQEMRRNLRLDVFCLMPNHLHGIVFLEDGVAHSSAALPRGSRTRTSASISSFMACFKAATTARVNTLRGTPGQPVWQPKFYEHVVRNDQDLLKCREYIVNNPQKWELDRENPDFKP